MEMIKKITFRLAAKEESLQIIDLQAFFL